MLWLVACVLWLWCLGRLATLVFCIEYCYKCMVSGVVCTYFLLG